MTQRFEKPFIPKQYAHLINDCRRLTKMEKKHPKSILKYPRDHVFKPYYNVRYTYDNGRETNNS